MVDFFGSTSSWLYNISDTNATNVATPLFGVWPTQILVVTPAHLHNATYTMHVDTPPSSMPPSQFTWYFHREHLLTVYFRYQMHFLLFLFNLGPTSAAESTDVKGVFKSISNTNTCVYDPSVDILPDVYGWSGSARGVTFTDVWSGLSYLTSNPDWSYLYFI